MVRSMGETKPNLTETVKFYATPWGSGCGANFTMTLAKFNELKGHNLLTPRVGGAYWFNGTLRAFDLLTLEFGKENQ